MGSLIFSLLLPLDQEWHVSTGRGIPTERGNKEGEGSIFYVAHNAAQEPILYYFGQVHIGGSFKGSWANGESLEPDRFCKKIT